MVPNGLTTYKYLLENGPIGAIRSDHVQSEATAEPSYSELDGHCREQLAGFKCPRSYEFVADVGRNTMGKINKRKLRGPYWPSDAALDNRNREIA